MLAQSSIESYPTLVLNSTEVRTKLIEHCFAEVCPKLVLHTEEVRSKTEQLIGRKMKMHLNKQNGDDPFYVVNLDEVVSRHYLWQRLLPRVEPHYAVKCNTDPVVLELLNHLGVGFDCASMKEIEQVLRMGVSPSRIVYANPCKQISFLKYAKQHHVDLTTFDSEYELYKVKEVYPDVRLLIRFVPPDEAKAAIPLGSKFGCQLNAVKKLILEAKRLALNVVGVSFHVGSSCLDSSAFISAVEAAREVFDIGLAAGFNMNLLDIGGGFPGVQQTDVTMEKICELLVPALDEHFPPSSGVRIIAEPGRYYVTTAFTLYVSIIGKKKIQDNTDPLPKQEHDSEVTLMYYLNDGIYGSFMDNFIYRDVDAVVDERKPLLINPQQYANKPLFKSSLWGPTCDPRDYIMRELRLPELSIGDWLMFRYMGAYATSESTEFNGMSKPHMYYFGYDTEKMASLKQVHYHDG